MKRLAAFSSSFNTPFKVNEHDHAHIDRTPINMCTFHLLQLHTKLLGLYTALLRCDVLYIMTIYNY